MFRFNPVVAISVAALFGLVVPALAQDAPDAVASAVVLPFATLGHLPQDDASLPNRACFAPQNSPAPTPVGASTLDAAVQSDLPAQLTAAISHEIHAGGAAIYSDLQSAPPRALIVAGCILHADAGDPAKRLIGMGMGASVLSVHIQVYRGNQANLGLIGEFDTEVTGENKLPPIGPVGLALHGIKGHSLTLKADTGKLAKLIAQRILTGQFGP